VPAWGGKRELRFRDKKGGSPWATVSKGGRKKKVSGGSRPNTPIQKEPKWGRKKGRTRLMKKKR